MESFKKAGKIKDWKIWINNLPQQKGVYAVTREEDIEPIFLEVGTGGFFKNENPNVTINELKEKWIKSNKTIMYIGKAGSDDAKKTNGSVIKKRVKAYMRFGNQKKSPHRGGKYIWQLENSGELIVWYFVCDNPEVTEGRLIKKYKPFANLKDEKI